MLSQLDGLTDTSAALHAPYRTQHAGRGVAPQQVRHVWLLRSANFRPDLPQLWSAGTQ